MEDKDEDIHTMVKLGDRDAAGITGKNLVFFKFWKKSKEDDNIQISNYRYNIPIVLIQNVIKGVQLINKQM